MKESNVFLTLTPCDRLGRAAAAFRLPHNSVRYEEPLIFPDDEPSRETKPCYAEHNDTFNTLDLLPRIFLTFDEKTKEKGRVIFGRDPDSCDVLLAPEGDQSGISRRHFYVTFDHQQRLIIRDTSTNGLSVSYNGQGENERRRHFEWIFLRNEFKRIAVHLDEDGPSFNVHFSKYHMKHEKEYKAHVKEFMADAPLEHEATFNHLVFNSQRTSFVPSESLTPNRRPIYLYHQKLGKDGFGNVWKVINASSGHEYAGKEFHLSQGWNKEIEIIKQLKHDHLVQLVDLRTTPKPLLVTEYLPFGTLKERHEASPISGEDMKVVFHQSLQALSYLHHRKITHGDLKPENIHFRCKSPIHVKIADFGSLQDKSELKTFCGSSTYAAPEIFLEQHYTDAVDIWSLGVIVMQFTYGLGQHKESANFKSRQEFRQLGQSWCRLLIQEANARDSDQTIDFLTRYMLRWEFGGRLSAAECLRIGSEIGLFDITFPPTGHCTPRAQPDRDGDDFDPNEVSSEIGPLWQAETFYRILFARYAPGHRDELFGPETSRSQCPRLPSGFETHVLRKPRQESSEVHHNHRTLPPLPQLSRNSNYMLQQPNLASLLHRDEGTHGICDPASTSQQYYRKPAKRKWSVVCDEQSQPTQLPRHSPQAITETINVATSPVPRPSPEPERVAYKLAYDRPGYVTMTIDGKAVALRTEDSWLNATQILNMAGKTRNQRAVMLRQVARSTKVDIHVFNCNRSTWVSLKDGVKLCHKLGVAKSLKPLFDYGEQLKPTTSGAKSLKVEAGKYCRPYSRRGSSN